MVSEVSRTGGKAQYAIATMGFAISLTALAMGIMMERYGGGVPVAVFWVAIPVAAVCLVMRAVGRPLVRILLDGIVFAALLHTIKLTGSPIYGLDYLYDLAAFDAIEQGGWPLKDGAVGRGVLYTGAYPALNILTSMLAQTAGWSITPLHPAVRLAPLFFHLVAGAFLLFYLHESGVPRVGQAAGMLGFVLSYKVFLIGYVRQTLATVFFFMTLFLLSRAPRVPSHRWSLLLVVIFGATVFAHNLTPLIALGFLFVSVMVYWYRRDNQTAKVWFNLSAILALLTVAFVIYLWIDPLLRAVNAFVPQEFTTTEGALVAPPFLEILGNYLMLLLAAAAAGVIILGLLRDRNSKSWSFRAIAGIWIASTVGGSIFVASRLPFYRIMPFVWPLAIAAVAWTLPLRNRAGWTAVLVGAFAVANVLLVPTHVYHPSSEPDFAHGRYPAGLQMADLHAARWLPESEEVRGSMLSARMYAYVHHRDINVDVRFMESGPYGPHLQPEWAIVRSTDYHFAVDELRRTSGKVGPDYELHLHVTPDIVHAYDNGIINAFYSVRTTRA